VASITQRLKALQPRAGARVQLFGAASMWLIGSWMLLMRGTGYVHDRHWHAWALAAGLALGVFKSRALLDGVARKAVTRIHERGVAGFFGFFSLRSWLLISLMMGGGITLRHLVVHPGVIGAGIMGALYIGVGTALFLADRILWRAAFAPIPAVAL